MGKYIKLLILVSIINICFTISCKAVDMNADEAINEIIPYNDEYIMTRSECMIALNKMIGISDKTVVAFSQIIRNDAEKKKDIDEHTYYGKFAFLGLSCYDNLVSSREDNMFYGDEYATWEDVLLWMVNCIYTGYKIDKNNLIEQAFEYNLIDTININQMDFIKAKDFKDLSKKFLMSTAGRYYEAYNEDNKYTIMYYIINGYNGDKNLTYLDVFNSTYICKNIKVTPNTIYLGNEKIEFSGEQPFVDEDGTMMMPIRWFAQLFHFEQKIVWIDSKKIITSKNGENSEMSQNEDEKSVIIMDSNGNKISFFVDNNKCEFGANARFIFDKSAEIIGGHIYLPLRSVCESFLYTVEWSE